MNSEWNKEHNYRVLESSDSFKNEVIESTIPVIVEMFAEWCGPSYKLSPYLESKLEEKKNFKMIRVNVDDHPSIVDTYQTIGLPHVMLFRNGKMESEYIGCNFERMDEMIGSIN